MDRGHDRTGKRSHTDRRQKNDGLRPVDSVAPPRSP